MAYVKFTMWQVTIHTELGSMVRVYNTRARVDEVIAACDEFYLANGYEVEEVEDYEWLDDDDLDAGEGDPDEYSEEN